MTEFIRPANVYGHTDVANQVNKHLTTLWKDVLDDPDEEYLPKVIRAETETGISTTIYFSTKRGTVVAELGDEDIEVVTVAGEVILPEVKFKMYEAV